MKKDLGKKGFTLVELLAVILILGLLMAFAYPAVLSVYNDIRIKSMVVKENDIRNNAKMYVEDCFDSKTKDTLSGCVYTDIMTDSGHVFLGDMIYDRYSEAVTYGDVQCEGYVEFLLDKYTVCIKCGDEYKTPDTSCTFDYEDNKIKTFAYTGSPQEFRVGKDQAGAYRIELWGASGSYNTGISDFADGAYTSGVIRLKENDVLYFYVGQSSNQANGLAYNGGQGTSGGWPGGGATDVRLVNGAYDSQEGLASRIMVAAGGGSGNRDKGAAGGGIVGYTSTSGAADGNASQLAGGQGQGGYSAGGFGHGGNGCGGGSGYYGGGGSECVAGGGSGSSYISGHTGCVAIISKDLIQPKTGCLTGNTSTNCSLHYSGMTFTSTVMIDGHGYSWKNVRGAKQLMPSTTYGQFFEIGTGNKGNGFARVTYLGK